VNPLLRPAHRSRFWLRQALRPQLRPLLHRRLHPPGRALSELFQALGHKPTRSLEEYRRELLDESALHDHYDSCVARGLIGRKYPTKENRFGDPYTTGNAMLCWGYALVREVRPSRIIETGTAAGSMTSVICAALHHNQHGQLVSIDLPAEKGKASMDWDLPPGESAGFLVVPAHRDRWQLRVGDAKDLLITALRETPCDIFIHDSLHHYDHMMWEYISALVNMQPGTLILSDDILGWSDVWFDFLRCFGLPNFIDLGNPNFGATIVRHKEA
jgi:hypothetical protein